MADPTTVVVVAATEGIVDEALVRRMIPDVGAQPGPVYGKHGKRHLRERITGYNNTARFGPWIVLLDLDHDAGCAPRFATIGSHAVQPKLLDESLQNQSTTIPP